MVQINEKEMPSCGTCFWAIKNNNPMAIGQQAAECRRFPPAVILIHGAPVLIWPMVNQDKRLYCGEWKERNIQ
jgi:hypothetical protein